MEHHPRPGFALRRHPRRLALTFALLALLLVASGVLGATFRGDAAARAEAPLATREVAMHLVFPDSPAAGLLTVTLFLLDDGSDLSSRIAEGKTAMLARFPGALELTASEVQAQFNISDNVRWPGLSASWSYNPAGASNAMPAQALLSAITAGAEGWSNAGGSGWKYVYAGPSVTATGCNGVPGELPRDATNVVGWGHIVSGYWGYTCWWRGPEKVEGTSFNALQEFDIVFENGPGIPYTPNALKALALHEFGHGLGLGHTAPALCPGHVMCAGSGATTFLSLTRDDIEGVVSLYGLAPTPTPTTPSPTPTPLPVSPKARSFLPAVARD